MKAIKDEFTNLNVNRYTKRYLRAKRDKICVRCFQKKAESDRVWCSNCRGLRRKLNTASNKKTIDQLHKKWIEAKPELKLKFFKPREKNYHHQYKYKGNFRSLKEICSMNNINYPMAKYWMRKGFSINKIIIMYNLNKQQ